MNRREFLGRLVNFYAVAKSIHEPWGLFYEFPYKINFIPHTISIHTVTTTGAKVLPNPLTPFGAESTALMICDDIGNCIYYGTVYSDGNNVVITRPGKYFLRLQNSGTMYQAHEVTEIEFEVRSITDDEKSDCGVTPNRLVDLEMVVQSRQQPYNIYGPGIVYYPKPTKIVQGY